MTTMDRTECRFDRDQARWIVWGLLIPIHLCLLGWMACRSSPTSDEIAHLAAGVRIWTTGRFDVYPVNPPLVKMVASLPVILDPPQTDWRQFTSKPGSRPEWSLGRDLMQANVPRFRWDFVIARWACLPFSVIGLVYCFRWGAALFGPTAGVMAATLWCFSPNILGNGALITPDVPATALGVAAMYHFRAWQWSSRWKDALLSGLLLGLTELTKMTWLVLYAVLPVLWLVVEWSRHRRQTNQSATEPSASPVEAETDRNVPIGSRCRQFVFLLFISLEVLNAGYLFEDVLRPLGKFEFVSQTLTGMSVADGVGNGFRDSWWSGVPVPLPGSYVRGMDLQRRDFEGRYKPLSSYLRGEQRQGGWWYYYLYGALVKVPLGVWGIVMCGLFSLIQQPLRRKTDSIIEWLLLLGPPLVVFLFVSSQTGFSRYFRYVLPCFPFAFIALSSLWSNRSPSSRRLRGIATVCLCCMVVESLLVYPHSLSFFNASIGGPREGHWHLLDSNVDWGQDLYALNDWQNAHPTAQPIYLAYSGVANPRLFGIEMKPVPQSLLKGSEPFPAGWYAISVNRLHSYDDPNSRWQEFLEQEPVDRVGYSIFIYHVARKENE